MAMRAIGQTAKKPAAKKAPPKPAAKAAPPKKAAAPAKKPAAKAPEKKAAAKPAEKKAVAKPAEKKAAATKPTGKAAASKPAAKAPEKTPAAKPADKKPAAKEAAAAKGADKKVPDSKQADKKAPAAKTPDKKTAEKKPAEKKTAEKKPAAAKAEKAPAAAAAAKKVPEPAEKKAPAKAEKAEAAEKPAEKKPAPKKAPKKATGDLENQLYLELSHGRVIIQLRPDLAPGHVARIKELARQNYYDGLNFHRVIEGFMAQTGDPRGDGTGGSGQKLKAEFSDAAHERGTVSMARAAAVDSADSQFFICFAPARFLDRQYTVWGQVSSGMEYVDQIKKGDRVQNGVVSDPDKIVSLKVAADVEE